MEQLKAYNVVATADVNPEVVDSLGCTEWAGYDKAEVDAVLAEKDAEIRRLNLKYWNDKADEAAKMKRLIHDGEIIYLDEYCKEKDWRIMYKVWEDEETKCRAMADKFKG